MANEYDNTNRGALFVNDKKESDQHPDWQGKIDVEGVEYWISAWKKKSKGGDPYMSLSIKPKEQRQAPRRQAPMRQAQPGDDFNDEIPW